MAGDTTRSRILEADRDAIWRPYTSAEQHAEEDPIVCNRAEGSFLYDHDGRRYIDGVSSWWTKSLGHRHPRLMQVLRDQSETLVHSAMAGMTNPHAALLAEELVRVAPAGLERVFFSDDGSTAVEVAVKMAFQFWQQNGAPKRTRFLTLAGAYHGDTMGTMSVGDLEDFHDLYSPLLFEVIRAPDPSTHGGWEKAVAFIEQRLTQDADSIAGVIVEPLLQGAIGMRMWPPELLLRLREVTRKVDTFLIADEVFTGFGRTGRFWACDHAGVSPDLLCSAKALTGGVAPLAATLATARIYEGFRGGLGRALLHGHTFAGYALGCAIGREVLAVYRDEHVIEGLEERGRMLDDLLATLRDSAHVERPRRIGLVAAFDLTGEGPQPTSYYGTLGPQVAARAKELGAYLRPLGNVVYLCPPLNVPVSVLQGLCRITLQAVQDVGTSHTQG